MGKVERDFKMEGKRATMVIAATAAPKARQAPKPAAGGKAVPAPAAAAPAPTAAEIERQEQIEMEAHLAEMAEAAEAEAEGEDEDNDEAEGTPERRRRNSLRAGRPAGNRQGIAALPPGWRHGLGVVCQAMSTHAWCHASIYSREA